MLLKIQNCHFKLIFGASHHIQFQKNISDRFKEMFKSVDFWPKNDSLTAFEHNKNFLKKFKNHFYPLLNASHQVSFLKELMHGIKKKVKSVSFRHKNFPHLPNFPMLGKSLLLKSKTVTFTTFLITLVRCNFREM